MSQPCACLLVFFKHYIKDTYIQVENGIISLLTDQSETENIRFSSFFHTQYRCADPGSEGLWLPNITLICQALLLNSLSKHPIYKLYK